MELSTLELEALALRLRLLARRADDRYMASVRDERTSTFDLGAEAAYYTAAILVDQMIAERTASGLIL